MEVSGTYTDTPGSLKNSNYGVSWNKCSTTLLNALVSYIPTIVNCCGLGIQSDKACPGDRTLRQTGPVGIAGATLLSG